MIDAHHSAAPIRTRAEIDALDRIDARVREIALACGAREMQYPVLISRQVLEQAGYPDAFPHLLMSATRSMVPQGGAQSQSRKRAFEGRHDDCFDWCLSPAVCHHVFAQLAGRTMGEATVLTARGRCFRAERETVVGVRQIEFEMREIVLLGSTSWIDSSADAARVAIESTAIDMGLAGDWQPAEDPFFPAATGRALMQRLLQLKLEYQSPGVGGVALCSINRHGSFFGDRFGITTREGEPVHSACLAFGLDRWAHAAAGARVAVSLGLWPDPERSEESTS